MNDDKPSSYRKMYNASKDLTQLIVKENVAYDYWKAKCHKLEKELRSQKTIENIFRECEKNVDLPDKLQKKIDDLTKKNKELTEMVMNFTDSEPDRLIIKLKRDLKESREYAAELEDETAFRQRQFHGTMTIIDELKAKLKKRNHLYLKNKDGTFIKVEMKVTR